MNPTRREKVEDEVSVVSQRYLEGGWEDAEGRGVEEGGDGEFEG